MRSSGGAHRIGPHCTHAGHTVGGGRNEELRLVTNPYVAAVPAGDPAGGFAVFSVFATSIAGPKRYNRAKLDAYGAASTHPSGSGGGRVPIKYLTAMLFIIFDIESVFLYPFAVAFNQLGLFALVEMVLFIITVFVAYAPCSGAAAGSSGTDRAGTSTQGQMMGIGSPAGFVLTTVEQVAEYMRKSSVWPATFGLACCAIEMMAVGTPTTTSPASAWAFSATPREADLMIVAEPGQDGAGRAPGLRPDAHPAKWVIAMGVCASSGGMFNNYAIVQGVDHIVPVDVYHLPGCPPRPEMLLNAILTLHEQIQGSKLGINRVAAARCGGGGAQSHPDAPDERPARMSGEKKGRRGPDPQQATASNNIDGTKAPTPPPTGVTDRTSLPPRSSAKTVKADAATEPSAACRRTYPLPRARPPTPWWSVSDTEGCSAERRRRHLGLRRHGHEGPVPGGHRPALRLYFDGLADTLERGLVGGDASFSEAIERVVVDRGELTLFVRREHLRAVARVLRDDPGRFEICTGVSGVHYRRDRPQAPRGLPPPCRSPTVADGSPSRSPAPTATPTSRPSSRSTRPTTGTSARRGTCSRSSSTATRP